MRINGFAILLTLALAGHASSQDESRPTPTWQEAMVHGLVPYHQLTVQDFPINDKAHPKNNFYVQTATAPQYHFVIKPYTGFAYAFIDQWLVFAGLDKNGTSRKSKFKSMEAELPYAQAILDINEIHARQIAALKPGELPQARGDTFEQARVELTRKLKEFLATKYKESEVEAEAFMKATGYGANKKKTRALAAEIRKRLDATPAATVPFPEPAAPSPTLAPANPAPSPTAANPGRGDS